MDTDTNLLELIDAEDDAHDPVLCQSHLDSGIVESSFKPGNARDTWIWAVSTCANMDNRFVSLLTRPGENVELEAFVQRCIDTGTCNDLYRLRKYHCPSVLKVTTAYDSNTGAVRYRVDCEERLRKRRLNPIEESHGEDCASRTT
jgi:hypothetical protein